MKVRMHATTKLTSKDIKELHQEFFRFDEIKDSIPYNLCVS